MSHDDVKLFSLHLATLIWCMLQKLERFRWNQDE